MASEQAKRTVSFRRTGGLFAGNVLATSVSVDDLDDAQREALQRHLEQADLEALAERSPITGAGADTYQYDIAVDDGARRSKVVVAQTAVPDQLRPLIEWLEQRASRPAPGPPAQ
ncbi:MAG: protealysin inhibitor emfourin [Pseudonocardiaceae bacterium]